MNLHMILQIYDFYSILCKNKMIFIIKKIEIFNYLILNINIYQWDIVKKNSHINIIL